MKAKSEKFTPTQRLEPTSFPSAPAKCPGCMARFKTHDLHLCDLPNGSVTGRCEFVFDTQHLERIVRDGLLRAATSVDIATADLKAMRVPSATGRSATSIIRHLARLADRGVEVRLLHAGVPSAPALHELRGKLPANLQIRRCPRLHAKTVIIDAAVCYLGSANLTGAGLGAKAAHRRNFEWGVQTESADMIDAVLQQFNAIWEGRHCDGCGRRDVCPAPLESPAL